MSRSMVAQMQQSHDCGLVKQGPSATAGQTIARVLETAGQGRAKREAFHVGIFDHISRREPLENPGTAGNVNTRSA